MRRAHEGEEARQDLVECFYVPTMCSLGHKERDEDGYCG